MAKSSSTKINLSSMQVLKTLQVLLEDNFSMNELIEKLNNKEDDAIFNNSVISKYINTCRYCGIDIPKINNKYYVTKMPFGMDLSIEEAELIEKLQTNVRDNMSSKQNKIFDKFLEKINRYSNKKIARVEKSSYLFSVEVFERAVQEKRKIKLIYKNRTELICIPIKFVETNGKLFFNIYVKNKERMVDVDRLCGIEVLNERFIQNFSDQSVVFVLQDDLAKRYNLKENEQIINQTENTITISNRGENKEVLFLRLLRYDDKCEILSPKIYREEFKQIIFNALENYGEV